MIYILHYQESKSQPVSSQVRAVSTRPVSDSDFHQSFYVDYHLQHSTVIIKSYNCTFQHVSDQRVFEPTVRWGDRLLCSQNFRHRQKHDLNGEQMNSILMASVTMHVTTCHVVLVGPKHRVVSDNCRHKIFSGAPFPNSNETWRPSPPCLLTPSMGMLWGFDHYTGITRAFIPSG